MFLSIVIPAYKEEENLRILLPQIKQALTFLDNDYEILIIDTMEPADHTEEVCKQEHCRYINRRGGNLYGDAIRTGVAEANGQYLIIMDADGSHDPKDIPRFLEAITEYDADLIIGSRYCQGGYTDNNFILRFMSWMLNVTYRIAFGIRIKDISDSFRLYKADQIKSLSLECDNFDVVEEILIKLYHSFQEFNAVEIPIYFSKRVFGDSKRDLVKFIISYLKTMKRLIRIKRDPKGER